jgi:hypothetical protein
MNSLWPLDPWTLELVPVKFPAPTTHLHHQRKNKIDHVAAMRLGVDRFLFPRPKAISICPYILMRSDILFDEGGTLQTSMVWIKTW